MDCMESNSLKNRLFSRLCIKMVSVYETLLLLTKIRYLFNGRDKILCKMGYSGIKIFYAPLLFGNFSAS